MKLATAIFRRAMMPFHRGYLRQLGMPVLFSAAVLLLSGVLMLGANIAGLRKNSAFIERTNQTLLQIAEVDARLVGVEMTVRGYALTDDPAFIEYQKHERARLSAAMVKLTPLIAAEASLADGFSRLRALVAKRLALFADLTSLGPGHAKDVAAAITDPEKRQVMVMIRRTVVSLRDRELELLAERQAAATLQAAHTYRLAIGIVILAFIVSALGLVFMLYGRAPQRDLARGS